MAHMHYTMLELIMLCKMYMNFESLDKILKWIKPKLEREIAQWARQGGGGIGKERGKGEVGEG